MTNETELRDRIADIIYQNCEADGYTKLSTAQAIIDDLGLTVETRNGDCVACFAAPESRVVGRWEKQ